MTESYDTAVVGAGLVGLATALAVLKACPRDRVIVLEKEGSVARHQSGRNSGVIHSGVYYKPGSVKARLCVQGREMLLAYCRERGIPVRAVGKMIVAVDDQQTAMLAELRRRGSANGIAGLEILSQAELRKREPHVAGGAALDVPVTAIVDYRAVAEALAKDITGRGGEVRTTRKLAAIDTTPEDLVLHLENQRLSCGRLINCAGLQSTAVARLAGMRPAIEIVPFRGEYYTLRSDRRDLIRGLVYPTPDPDLPFLGVHFTPQINGSVEAGPNAVLAWAREGYRSRDGDIGYVVHLLGTPHFRAMTRRYWRVGLDEFRRSLSKRQFVEALRQLVPELRMSDLSAGGAGVRAQAVSADGHLVDDFVIERTPRALHVLNAVSQQQRPASLLGSTSRKWHSRAPAPNSARAFWSLIHTGVGLPFTVSVVDRPSGSAGGLDHNERYGFRGRRTIRPEGIHNRCGTADHCGMNGYLLGSVLASAEGISLQLRQMS